MFPITPRGFRSDSTGVLKQTNPSRGQRFGGEKTSRRTHVHPTGTSARLQAGGFLSQSPVGLPSAPTLTPSVGAR
jgi:hypothetical protein